MLVEDFNKVKIYYTTPEYLHQFSNRLDLNGKYDKLYWLREMEKSKKTIKENGFIIKSRNSDGSGNPNVPILQLDSHGFGFLIDGNHRVKACLDLGLEKIPFFLEQTLSDSETNKAHSHFVKSKEITYKYITDKYPELKKDKELKDVLSSAAFGIVNNPVKVCDKKLIQDNLFTGDYWEYKQIPLLPINFIEKTNFYLL